MPQADVTKLTPGPIEKTRVEAFIRATDSNHCGEVPLTFATIYRQAEFAWLEKNNVDLRHLLHGEQEYSYKEDFKIGDDVHVKTSLLDLKERSRGGFKIQFIKLESEFAVEDRIKATALTTFVVRVPEAQS